MAEKVSSITKAPAVSDVHILWITAGLSCDGDSVSVTAAEQPSIEDVLLGAIPGLPKVHLHNPVLAYENGDEFMKFFYEAEKGLLDPFVLVVEGSIPNEKIKKEGYWAAMGTNPDTGQPITTCEWIDRLAPKALAIIGAGTCATYGGIHAMAGNPTGCHGTCRLSRMGLAFEGRAADRQCSWLPGAAGQLYGNCAVPAVPGGRPGADDSSGQATAAHLALRQDGARGLRSRLVLRAGRLCHALRIFEMPGEARLLGSGGRLQRNQARLDARYRRLPQRGRHLHRLHHAGFPDKFMPFMDEPPGAKLSTNIIGTYGRFIRTMRGITNTTVNKEPKWRHPRACSLPLATSRQLTKTEQPALENLDGHKQNRKDTSMATYPETIPEIDKRKRNLVEMNWDPITRIVGSLGIFTKIDFANREVAECHSTSSIFRGYSIFMKGKDPRDAHFITSRICGICGDNHATCAVYAQNMAFGVKPPPLAEWIINLGEAAEYMFDHNIFQDNLVGVDFCEQMVKETNPGVWAKAQSTTCPNADKHGYRTIADIMTALNPFTGSSIARRWP